MEFASLVKDVFFENKFSANERTQICNRSCDSHSQIPTENQHSFHLKNTFGETNTFSYKKLVTEKRT